MIHDHRFSTRAGQTQFFDSHSWQQGIGEGRSVVSTADATSGAITQAVRELCRQLAAVRDARAFQRRGL